MIDTSRSGRKVLHQDWRWIRQDSSAVAVQGALVAEMLAMEKTAKTIKIITIGTDYVDFRLEKAIKYDGASVKIKRMLEKVKTGKQAFNEWCLQSRTAVTAANATAVLEDPGQGEQPLNQVEAPAATAGKTAPAATAWNTAPAATAWASGTPSVAATAAEYPMPLQLLRLFEARL